jgi:hypothetical protein
MGATMEKRRRERKGKRPEPEGFLPLLPRDREPT